MYLLIVILLTRLGVAMINVSKWDKKRRIWIGYRTFKSMKNQHTWELAQKTYKGYFVKLLKVSFVPLLLWTIFDLGIILLQKWHFVEDGSVMIQIFLTLIIMIHSIIHTERILKKFIKENGY